MAQTGSKKKVLKQDLSLKENSSGKIVMSLLFREETPFPGSEALQKALGSHLGPVTAMKYSDKMAAFAAEGFSYSLNGDQELTPQLLLLPCIPVDEPLLDDVAASQLARSPGAAEVLENCHYQIVATDLLATGMDRRQHAHMLLVFLKALMEVFPACEGVFCSSSKNVISRQFIADTFEDAEMPESIKFIELFISIRFFRQEGSGDFLVDSLGMGALDLPDVQYHFHGMEPDQVIAHAFGILSYMHDHGCTMKSGDTFDGLDSDYEMTERVQWELNFENALVQPVREVIDINMGPYASGNR